MIVMCMIVYFVSYYVFIYDVFIVKILIVIVNYSGLFVKFKMVVNLILWKMFFRFSFYFVKLKWKICVKLYLIEFKRLLELSIIVFEGVNGFFLMLMFLKIIRVFCY